MNQNPHYNEWRQAISNVFSRIDPLLDAEVKRRGKPALVVVIAPPELPVDSGRMWLRLRQRGKPIPLDLPDEEDYLPLVVKDSAGKSILEMYSKNRYDSWAISAGREIADRPNAVGLGYDNLKAYRSRLMTELRRMLEFVRSTLLTGNGTLLINNPFVEWATIQAVRRARPTLVIASFGIRNKLKPFSSMLMYTDQDAANPIPSQNGHFGTYIDLEIFYQYIWQEFEKYAQYRNNTAYLFVAGGMEELFCIAPPDFPLLAAKAPVMFPEVFDCAKQWLNI